MSPRPIPAALPIGVLVACLAGCATAPLRLPTSPRPTVSLRAQVPAQPELLVAVPHARLVELATDHGATWAALDPSALHVTVRLENEAVPCQLTRGKSPAVLFRVHRGTRHAPYLVYTLELRPGWLEPESSLTCTAGRRPKGAAVYVATPVATETAPLALEPTADWIAIGPRAVLPALETLVEHRRSQGHVPARVAVEDLFDRYGEGNPSPEVLARAVAALRDATRGRLRHVLLIGTTRASYVPNASGPTPVPAAYLPKVPYAEMYSSYKDFPSDAPLAAPDLAVGRLPTDEPSVVRAFAAKVVRYETDRRDGPWRRRIVLYGGPANYGPVADAIIESVATTLLDRVVPYDYDLSFVFANAKSPYAYRLDRLGQRLVEDLNHGALFAAYVGHGLPSHFDDATWRGESWPIGSAAELRKVDIERGAPFFLSLTCLTGAFDQPNGEVSVAESLALNPRGPVAVIASSRESHPYPNALLAEGFIDTFLSRRPRTIGEGVTTWKRELLGRSNVLAEAMFSTDAVLLKREHQSLYNLFGDPATRIRYPAPAAVEVVTAPLRQDAPVEVSLRVAGVDRGQATVTLETLRSKIRGTLVGPGALAELPLDEALSAMAKNHATAIDKVVAREVVPLFGGTAMHRFEAPTTPGHYVIKVFVRGDDGFEAMGSTRFEVLPRRS